MRTEMRAVSFPNRSGHRLFGILHESATDVRRDLAVVLLSPGIKSRVGPHRLYVKLTHTLVRLGFRVLRFDFYGLGDSEGEVREPLVADLYGSIQVGRYVQDTESALDWMRTEFGTRQFILAGLCGGALTGLLTAQSRSDIAGILALGLPVMLDGSNVDKVRQMTDGQLQSVRRRYFRKLCDPLAWVRLLTLQSNFRLLARSLSRGKAKAANVSGNSAPQPGAAAGKSRRAAATNANPHIPPAFERALKRSCRILLLFSESDRLYWEFREKFFEPHGARLFARYPGLVEVDLVAGANHVFTLTEWQDAMMEISRSWLVRQFASRETTLVSTTGVPVTQETA